MAKAVAGERNPEEQYELREQLGKGSYGTVFKAVDKATSEMVAIKIIPLAATEEDGFAEIQREIETLQVRSISGADLRYGESSADAA